MAARDAEELRRIIKSVEDWRKISDRLFQVGPIKVGLDGVLTWIPGVGDAYTLGAGGYLLYNAARARASKRTLTKMGLLLGTDALIGSVPILGDAFDFFFRAHARSARILLAELNAHPALTEGAAAPRTASAPSDAEKAQARLVSDLRAGPPG